MVYLISYLVLINALGYLLMRLDKKKARRRQPRLPERLLLAISLIGGSIGTLIAMHQYRHKLRYRRFRYGVPAMLFIQAIMSLLIFSLK